jgi:hypothetical protein
MSAPGRPERKLLPPGGTARSAKGGPVTGAGGSRESTRAFAPWRGT